VTYHPTHSGVKVVPVRDGIAPANGSADHAAQPFILRDLAGATLFEIPPDGKWTLERVLELLNGHRACECVSEAFGADAYIGTQWIGSTEV
jgi:hypothetical protein